MSLRVVYVLWVAEWIATVLRLRRFVWIGAGVGISTWLGIGVAVIIATGIFVFHRKLSAHKPPYPSLKIMSNMAKFVSAGSFLRYVVGFYAQARICTDCAICGEESPLMANYVVVAYMAVVAWGYRHRRLLPPAQSVPPQNLPLPTAIKGLVKGCCMRVHIRSPPCGR